jgi:hypothetical protein
MDKQDELRMRVVTDVQHVIQLTSKQNFPLGEYLDQTSLTALCDSLSLDSNKWDREDLKRILIIRDGFYGLRNDLRDKGDEKAEHSTEQILGGLDRLYVDLQRVLDIKTLDMAQAFEELADLRQQPAVSSSNCQLRVRTLRQAANELLTETHITQRIIEINIIKIDKLDISLDILKKAQLNVQRLSASILSIKFSLEQSIIFQGYFELLNAGADKVLSELKALAREIQRAYSHAEEFVGQITRLSESGGRFVKMVSNFMKQIFSDQPISEKNIVLVELAACERGALLCGAWIGSDVVLCGGELGELVLLDVAAKAKGSEGRISQGKILALADLGSGAVALGGSHGLEILDTVVTKNTRAPNALARFWSESYELTARPRSLLRARDIGDVNAIQRVDWKDSSGRAGLVFAGGSSGYLRRWSESDFEEQGGTAIGANIKKIAAFQDDLLIATPEALLTLNPGFDISARIPLPFTINDFDVIDRQAIVVCGRGSLAQVSPHQGDYLRTLPLEGHGNYTAVLNLAKNLVLLGTDRGTLVAVNLASGAELGSIELNFPIRGLIASGTRVVAYGGDEKSAKCAAFIAWREESD